MCFFSNACQEWKVFSSNPDEHCIFFTFIIIIIHFFAELKFSFFFVFFKTPNSCRRCFGGPWVADLTQCLSQTVSWICCLQELCHQLRQRRSGMTAILQLCIHLQDGSRGEQVKEDLRPLSLNLLRRWEAIVLQAVQWQAHLQQSLDPQLVPKQCTFITAALIVCYFHKFVLFSSCPDIQLAFTSTVIEILKKFKIIF